jgi:hypothetical protein
LIKKLKWRTFTTGKFLIGQLSDKNKQMNPATDVLSFSSLGRKPYIELGYGINNIFKVLRVEAIHRLSYIDSPNVKKFGVKFTLELTL